MDTRGCRCKSSLSETGVFDLLIWIRNHHERTIEGDLFSAFVAAGAISKANSDDPKKSSLIRCARTDKGVHAAGNLISLKLIIEDPDIVQKINEKLTPQIRVFSIERTNGSFSAYQFCDSRIYEYLIPSHAFLPPHPSSFLGKMLVELAEEASDLEGYQNRQRDASTFWEDTEEKYINPVLEQLDPSVRSTLFKALHETDANPFHVNKPKGSVAGNQAGSDIPIFQHFKTDFGVGPDELTTTDIIKQPTASKPEDPVQQWIKAELEDPAQHYVNEKEDATQDQRDACNQPVANVKEEDVTRDQSDTSDQVFAKLKQEDTTQDQKRTFDQLVANVMEENVTQDQGDTSDQLGDPSPKPPDPSLDIAIKKVRARYIAARKAYCIHPDRLARIRSALSSFLGCQNYHNYTINKDFRDPSAKRVIKSFVVHDQPILINGTEWLSLKVHGQSFMMHQIRKMVSMVALIVRCGCHEDRIQDSYKKEKMNIPKAPGLGLLLERPVFDTYNEKLVGQFGREKIDFGKVEDVMEEFKQREIYDRIFREEERDNQFVLLSFQILLLSPSSNSKTANRRKKKKRFHSFFSSLDNFKSPHFLYLSSIGPPATRRPLPAAAETCKPVLAGNSEEEGDEDDEDGGGEG